MKKEIPFCPIPFEEMEIHSKGEVYTCCPSWNHFYSIGNIFESDFEEVWNSKEAIKLRNNILNNDYSLCNEQTCYLKGNNSFFSVHKTDYKTKMEEAPKLIKLGYDYECNIACCFCRDNVKHLSEEELTKYNALIDSFFIPMLRSTKILTVNTHGDAFASRHTRNLIKKAIEKYPDLKFDFLTNGILCSQKTFEALNITPEKIDTIRITINAASKEVYGKVIKDGEKYFDLIIKNLEYLSELHKKHPFVFLIQFVVLSTNYHEMPKFVELAQRYGAFPLFWEYRKDSIGYADYHKELSIVDEEHPQHNKLIEVLHHPNMYIFEGSLYPKLKELQNQQ